MTSESFRTQTAIILTPKLVKHRGVMALPAKVSRPKSEASEDPKQESLTRKRKRTTTCTPSKLRTPTAHLGCSTPGKKKKILSSGKVKPKEKRLKRFRNHAPGSYLEKLHRATTQRMFVIDRSRSGTDDCLEEAIVIAGTTGNIYTVLHNVLKAPEHLQYQLAFLSSEIRQIFDAAPVPIVSTDTIPDDSSNRKTIEGDCPICFMPFDPSVEEIVFCKAACGNNIHADCFEQWAKSQAGNEVRCVYCRTPWQGDEEQVKRICKDKAKSGRKGVNGEGYVNVAQELGMSGARGEF
ncbi:MAG: hypothetical protein Q9163_002266 [Psora crenata]